MKKAIELFLLLFCLFYFFILLVFLKISKKYPNGHIYLHQNLGENIEKTKKKLPIIITLIGAACILNIENGSIVLTSNSKL